MMKSIIPNNGKFILHLIKNKLLNVRKGYILKFAKRRDDNYSYSGKIQLSQKLVSNPGKAVIELIQVQPNEIFSFWKTVEVPLKKMSL